MPEFDSDDDQYKELKIALQRSKEDPRSRNWGKEIIMAIDANDVARIVQCYKSRGYLGADINM